MVLCGWAHRRRDHGGFIFIDLRDREGQVQVVLDPDRPEVFRRTEQVRSEYQITDPAIVAAATLSHRSITDRQLPDKAIDLIDEAPSQTCMEIVRHAFRPEFIPASVYWAIVTMTTVGYGDVTPHTDLGRLIASAMMLIGWGILAVPTGIVTAEMTAQRFLRRATTRTCHECLSEGHEADARFCKDCGARLPEYAHD